MTTSDTVKAFVSVTCEGERCRCGEPAVAKVGEEIPPDDPMPHRHNLTAYVCARHYAEIMGPLGAEQVCYTRANTPPDPEIVELDDARRTLQIWLDDDGHNAPGYYDSIPANYDIRKAVRSLIAAMGTIASDGGEVEGLREARLTPAKTATALIGKGDWTIPDGAFQSVIRSLDKALEAARP